MYTLFVTSTLALIKAGTTITPLGLILHFGFNLLFSILIIHFLYYRRSKRIDYYFTFLLLSSSVFILIFMLSGLKLKMGFALGLFAVFGIMKYRTESIPVREMTYLFVLVANSVINALGTNLGWESLLTANVLILVLISLSEIVFGKRKGVKYLKYDRLDLCKKSRRAEMIADIEQRFELKVISVHIGSINCLKDMALVKVYYEPDDNDNLDEEIIRLPKE